MLLPKMTGAEPQGRERGGDCCGKDWGGRSQGEHLQKTVMRGRERTLGHWHTGGVGGHSEAEISEDKVSCREVTGKKG